MHTKRGFDRLVNFSDAVVAIAITLLVLPLVNVAANIGSRSVGNLLAANGYKVFVFVLSFAVIGRLWLVHHRVFESVIDYNNALLMVNLVWLLSIVFLPFPTELLAASSNRQQTAVYGLYVGTILVASATMAAQEWIIIRSPELQAEAGRGALSLIPAAVPTLLLVVAFIVAVTIPAIGLWAMSVLLLAEPIERLVKHRLPASAPS